MGPAPGPAPLTHRRVLKISLPIMLAAMTTPLIGVVDTGVVGQIPAAEPIAAVGVGAVILSAVYWIFGFLRMGTTGLTAQAAGQGDSAEVAALLTRGLMEMVYFGKAMGSEAQAFFGTAGIGDLIATATSKKSRNYTFGFRIGQGESLEEVSNTMPELAEGVRTLRITRHLAKFYKLRVPITEMLYQIVFEGFPIQKAMDYLMTFPYDVDVDIL